jgi:gliding motility-associated-like protein
MKQILLFLVFIITTPLFSQNKNQSIGFKENRGQIIDQKGKPNTAVKYLLNSNGLNVQLKKNGFSYDLYKVKKTPITHSSTPKKLRYSIPEKDTKEKTDFNLEYTFHRIDIDFVNSNSNVELITDQESKDFDNYYNIPNKQEGIVGVRQYKQITYKNIYPSIDVVFTIPNDPQKTVEYNFVIHPKGKIADIQLKFNGAETDLVDNKIQMNLRFGKMEETLPASWIEEGNSKKEIAVWYRKIKGNIYGFTSSDAVSDKTVIIDPVPVRLWGTFYGDQTGVHSTLKPSSISTDSFGNAYVAGSTSALNSSYATTGAHQTTQSSAYLNGIIEKFSPDGIRLWGTYYGGQNYCDISDIKIDFQNNVIVTGSTQDQTNISTVGSYKPNLTGYSDAFLVKFNNAGARLWGTYFGGEYQDLGFAVDVDNNNNIYLIGQTTSTTAIAINSNFQTHINEDPNFSNTIDGYLTKFGSGGNLIWSTYVGGENRDQLNDIVVKNNYLIIGGTTSSFSNISTPGVFQELHNPITHPDGVIFKFSLNGQRIWASYYGGEQVEELYAVEVDDEDNIYIGGQTASNNNITTLNSFESSNTFLYKGFLAKLNSNGKRIWGTYVGQAFVYSIVSRNNSIYLGATNFGFSHPKLTTPCSYRSNKNFERYIAKFSKEADFIWGTDIGGDVSHSPTKIALDKNNDIFASGISRENNGIADANSYQSNVLGFYNYFLIKFQESLTNSIPNITSNSPVCAAAILELKASGGTNYSWTGPNGFTSTDQNPTITNAIAINSGEYSCLITGTSGCDGTKKINVVIGNTPPPTAEANQPFCSGSTPTLANIQVTGNIIKWYESASNGSVLPTTANLQDGKTYYASQTVNTCEGPRFGVTVSIVNTPLAPTGNANQQFCKSENATLNNIQISGQNLNWYSSNIAAGTLPSNTLLENNTTYYVSQTIGCESDRTPISVKVNDTALPTGKTEQQFCVNENTTIDNINITGTAIIWYDTISAANILPNITLLQNGTYYASQTLNNCESQRLPITIKIQDTQIQIADSPQTFCIQESTLVKDIDIAGQNIKWFETISSAIVLSESTPLKSGFTYYASQTVNNCESDRIPVTVNILEATDKDCINLVAKLPFPKFFTPNNDSYNDTWTIDFDYLAPNSSIRIFDRYGKFIKELSKNTSWDGTYSGHDLPASDYWFTVTRVNGTEFRGHFSLKR